MWFFSLTKHAWFIEICNEVGNIVFDLHNQCVKKWLYIGVVPSPYSLFSLEQPPSPNPNLAEKHPGWENASFPVKFVRCKSNLTDIYL